MRGLVNSHGSCSNNPRLFINQHFCLALLSGLPASSPSCSSTLSQHTALTLCYITTQRALVLIFVIHTRIFLLQTFVLSVANNLAAASVTLEGSFLNSLPQDAGRYLDGWACSTAACCHTRLSSHTVLRVGTRSWGAKPLCSRPLVQQPSDQYCKLVTLAHCRQTTSCTWPYGTHGSQYKIVGLYNGDRLCSLWGRKLNFKLDLYGLTV